MSLTFNTSFIKWTAPEGQATVKIVNSSNARFAIKVKTTNVDTYTTTPNVDFIEPGFTVNLVVCRKKSLMKEDRLGISYLEVSPDAKDAAEVFKQPNVRPSIFIVTMKCEETNTVTYETSSQPTASTSR
uniref:Major sperm protein n=1 Tax=Caenorhabditis japonica TaxID=281687 RepID=A0A8R1HTQ8_CAEJA